MARLQLDSACASGPFGQEVAFPSAEKEYVFPVCPLFQAKSKGTLRLYFWGLSKAMSCSSLIFPSGFRGTRFHRTDLLPSTGRARPIASRPRPCCPGAAQQLRPRGSARFGRSQCLSLPSERAVSESKAIVQMQQKLGCIQFVIPGFLDILQHLPMVWGLFRFPIK